MQARHIYRFCLLALIVLYIAVRIWRLNDSCLWFDEIFSVHAAEHSWLGLFSFAAADLIHPPLFYILLKTWILLGGESLLWLRLLPAFISFVAVIPFLLLCREFLPRRSATLFAFLLFAVDGSLIKYSQEVRMYSLLMCLGLFSIWLLCRWRYEGKGIILLTIVNTLLVYTHYAGWLIIGSEFLVVLFFQRELLKRFCCIAGIAVAVFVPWLIAVWRASVRGDLAENIGWVERPGPASLLQFLLNLFEPFYSQPSSIGAVSIYQVTIPILLIVLVSVTAFLSQSPANEPDRSRRAWLLFAIAPTVLLFVTSLILPYSVWGTRHLVFVFPLIFILIASVISGVYSDWLRIGSITLISLFVCYAFVLQIQRPVEPQIWCAWEQLAQRIEEDSEPKKLYVFEDLNAYHFWFATRNRNDLKIIKVNGVADMVEDKAYFLPRGFDGVQPISSDEMSGDHFWIAFRDMKWDERHPPLDLLLMRGYKIGEPEIVEADGLKAFLVKIDK